MALKSSSADGRTRSSIQIFIVVGLCCFFYILGAWQRSGFGKADNLAMEITKSTGDCNIIPNLNFETHHGGDAGSSDDSDSKPKTFQPCHSRFTDYTPCQDQKRAMTFPRENMIYRERHCPPQEEKLHCLIPAPQGYVTPFPWPKSLRTALDTGCGVASLGAYLWSRNVITMSFAPRDSHEAQVQFALERGVPAVIGVFGSVKLPYPSKAFDMAHCSRCLIPWGANDGMYLMEVDRVLRPGGYWVLSGPPINWKNNYKSWQRPKEELQEEQRKIEETAKLLCWDKKYEKGEMAIWQKRVNADSCRARQDDSRATLCKSADVDDVWYKKMEACITPYSDSGSSDELAGGALKVFPERLYAIPPRVASGSIPGVSVETYQDYNNEWKKHVNAYKKINKLIDSGRYRNIMDMNAGLGGFAAALESPKLWVMNVVPTIAEKSTLGVIYERGLIGIYHDWCEAFSTYPRTYDLIHASGVFSLYRDKCDMEDILLEMDRILRPEGAVIFRDEVDVLVKVRKMVGGMKWDTKMVDHEDGPLVPEKILVAVKQYWVGNSTSAQ
ncbi:hypothetical protein D5086_016736 [Populus alba]|uniref:Uncharacterized protein n=1 Tax=Populus alba TaxID=43335 RepID=A0ACC4BUT0_POPAL